jgi:hypothetical protein
MASLEESRGCEEPEVPVHASTSPSTLHPSTPTPPAQGHPMTPLGHTQGPAEPEASELSMNIACPSFVMFLTLTAA